MMSKRSRVVLIIDDCQEDRELFKRFFLLDQDFSYTIFEAELGRQGLDLWQKHQPDVVLLDYRLPDLDGLEILRELREVSKKSCLPVIIVSGEGNESLVVKAIKGGAQDYLVKGHITLEGLQVAVNATILTVQMRTELNQRVEKDQLVLQITQKIFQARNLDEIMQTVVMGMLEFLKIDYAAIFHLQPDGLSILKAEAMAESWPSHLCDSHYDASLKKDYFESMGQEHIAIHLDDLKCLEQSKNTQAQAKLIMPIVQGEKLWGILVGIHCGTSRHWESLEIGLIKELSSQLSIALQQADLSQKVQDELLERRRAEMELRASEERLRLALSAAYMGTWDWNIHNGQVSCSDILQSLFGFSKEEFDGSLKLIAERICPQDHDIVMTSVFNSINNKSDYDIEFRVICSEGTVRWLHSQGRVYSNLAGQPIRMTGVTVDITERKMSQQALQESEEFRKRVVESSPDCIKVLDVKGQLIYMNGAGMCLLEIEDFDSYLHSPWCGFWEGEYLEQAQQALTEALSGLIYSFQGYSPTVKGTPKWWDVSVNPMFNTFGDVESVLVVSRDISDRKHAEVERERLLTEEQKAREEAERANQAKDDFLAILSHELRAPLNPILGWAQLLQIRTFDKIKTAEALATIERSARSQAKLIDDLLDVAKILRGKLNLEAVPTNLVLVIASALHGAKLAAEAKSIQILSFLPSAIFVSGDRIRLQQVIWNLLSNAIKFTPSHGRVDIRLERTGGMVQITVCDTGKGIDHHFLRHIFEPFRQEDSSTTRKYGGLGLGLAISRTLVEAHGGTISADSQGEGKGATFTVKLPLSNIEPEKVIAKQVPVRELQLAGLKILVVDDDPDTLSLIEVLLTRCDSQVMSVASATAALACLESFQPDILVSDIGMPEMDGYALIQQIRALPVEKGGKIPALALSAYVKEEDRVRAFASGFNKYVNKPINLDLFVRAIDELADTLISRSK
jgi:PAS domain S-box-containing protein